MSRWIRSFILLLAAGGILLRPESAYGFSAAGDGGNVVLSVQTSPDAVYRSETRVTLSVRKLFGQSVRRKAESFPYTDTLMKVRETGGEHIYPVSAMGELYDSSGREVIRPGESLRGELVKQIALLHRKHYGELISWNDAQKAVPRQAKFEVLDLETGLAFRVQRRAGRQHADVQPLTKKDTAVMKSIYGGKWSWNRRAVLVRYDGHSYAASMNGMPHGGDGIPENGFSGHSCIHFAGSTTHKSRSKDTAHQFMAHRAAGMAGSFVGKASPQELADLVVTAFDQHDDAILELLGRPHNRVRLEELKKDSRSFVSVRRLTEWKPEEARKAEEEYVYELPVELAFEEEGKSPRKAICRFIFTRASLYDPWELTQFEYPEPGRPGKRTEGGRNSRQKK
ncbi:hypothetical protein ACFVVQ_01860 [Paenibacillus chitinolyticus]|uniref:hypothetical protein n=1 Tax=Paenibacillus chitinolyticus TaxID=79263 RepID=UPI0036DC7284